MAVARASIRSDSGRYQLEDWSGSLISTLRPVATPSQTSSDRHPLAAGSMTWEGKGLFKVRLTSGLAQHSLMLVFFHVLRSSLALWQVDSYDDGIHSIGRHDILLSG